MIHNRIDEFLNNFFLIRNFIIRNFDVVQEKGFFEDVSKKDLEAPIKDIKQILFEYLDKMDDLNKLFYSPAARYCIEKFVDGEMDHSTPGTRGFGRMSAYIPRFGGFYSKILKNLSKAELEVIKEIISKIIKYGYMKSVFLDASIDKKPSKLKPIKDETLFKKWIPEIYVSNLPEDQDINNLIDGGCWENIIYFCFRIERETNFPKKFLDPRNTYKDKLVLIISKYVEGGFLLRISEKRIIETVQ